MGSQFKGYKSKSEYRAAQVAAHNAEYERLQARTPEEKDGDLREMIKGVTQKVVDDARHSLFGPGKPKKVKRWK